MLIKLLSVLKINIFLIRLHLNFKTCLIYSRGVNLIWGELFEKKSEIKLENGVILTNG